MLESLLLNWIWTFFWEKCSVEIKAIWLKLSLFEKIHILNIFQIIVSGFIMLITKNFKFIFNLEFLVLFIASIIWSILFNLFVMKAIEKADRSTNTLLSIVAIPLLLISDILLWYNITTYNIIWIIFIVTVLLLISFRWTINTKWAKYVLITQFFAFINIALFKYMISNYTSTEMLNVIQSFSMATISFIIVVKNKWWARKIVELYDRKYILFWLYSWLWWALNSMWFAFWPASIITAMKRILSMFWWVVMWKIYFHEEKTLQKFASVWFLSLWVVIMNFQAISSNKQFLASINSSLLKWDIKWYKQELEANWVNLWDNLKNNLSRVDQLYWIQ